GPRRAGGPGVRRAAAGRAGRGRGAVRGRGARRAHRRGGGPSLAPSGRPVAGRVPGVTFSAQLRDLTGPTWDAAVGHRFVDEIWRGALDTEVLTTYFVQDHQFVDAFLALMGAAVAAADRADARVVHARQLGVVAGPENDFFARAL